MISSEAWLPADLDDVLWGITEASLLNPEQFKEKEFNSDIRKFVGLLLSEQGINKIPESLSFAILPEESQSRLTEAMGPDMMDEGYWERLDQEREELVETSNIKLKGMLQQVATLPTGMDEEFRTGLQEDREFQF